VVERADLVAELVRDVDHLRHFIRAIAVVVNENVSAQDLRQRLVAEIALRWITLVIGVPLVPLPTVSLGGDPRRPVTGDVSHPGGWSTSLIDPFRVFAAGHLQAVFRAGEFHRLHRAPGYDFEDDTPCRRSD